MIQGWGGLRNPDELQILIVLIPFGSGLGGFKKPTAKDKADTVLIPFGSGLGGLPCNEHSPAFLSLNPFWFRAGGVRGFAGVYAHRIVLIPFGSGLGGLPSFDQMAEKIAVLIPFGSGLGGLKELEEIDADNPA